MTDSIKTPDNSPQQTHININPTSNNSVSDQSISIGDKAKDILGIGGASARHAIDASKIAATNANEGFSHIAQSGVEQASARFKTAGSSPGYGFQGAEAKAVYSTTIQNRINADKADMKACLEGGHIETLRNGTLVSTACSKLMDANKALFSDPDKFQQKWNEFLESPHGKSCANDLKGADPNTTLKPTMNLATKGYHNEYHANEMFADTVVKLHQEGVNPSLCIAGGTMAYFHDLVQGLDGFPGAGKNENVTAKFLNFLVDEQVANGSLDKKTGDAIQSLSDATIVGGTFLVGIMGPDGAKNQTPSECVDNSDLQTPGHEQDYEDLTRIRDMMARNDISRTQEQDYTVRPDASTVDTSTPEGKIIETCYEAKTNAFDQRSTQIESNQAYKKLNLPVQHFARTCQSIRILTELLPKAPNSTFNEASIVNNIRNDQPQDSHYEHSLQTLVDKLKNPITWSGGMVEGRFIPGEAHFAKPSGHEEYANILQSDEFKQNLANLDDNDVKAWIHCALSDIQDGKYIGERLARQ